MIDCNVNSNYTKINLQDIQRNQRILNIQGSTVFYYEILKAFNDHQIFVFETQVILDKEAIHIYLKTTTDDKDINGYHSKLAIVSF